MWFKTKIKFSRGIYKKKFDIKLLDEKNEKSGINLFINIVNRKK